MTLTQNTRLLYFLLLVILVATVLFTAFYFGGAYLMHQLWPATHHTLAIISHRP